MSAEMARKVLQIIDDAAGQQPSGIEFELAYQARVAIDRIKFAIEHIERFAPRTPQMREATLQLLDALTRLESADRKFQRRLQAWSGCRNNHPPDEELGVGATHGPKGDPV